jgi:hypothetical protein
VTYSRIVIHYKNTNQSARPFAQRQHYKVKIGVSGLCGQYCKIPSISRVTAEVTK